MERKRGRGEKFFLGALKEEGEGRGAKTPLVGLLGKAGMIN